MKLGPKQIDKLLLAHSRRSKSIMAQGAADRKICASLVRKGLVSQDGDGSDVYRLTEQGAAVAAKKLED